MYLYARILPNSFTEKYQILISNFVKRYSSYSAIKYLRKFLHREFNGWYYRKVKKIPNSFQKVISKRWWNFLIIPIKKDTVQHPLSLLRNIFHEGIDEINESSKSRSKKKKKGEKDLKQRSELPPCIHVVNTIAPQWSEQHPVETWPRYAGAWILVVFLVATRLVAA